MPCSSARLAAKLRVVLVDLGEQMSMNYLLVFIGGGLGSTLRHIINVVMRRALGTAFPYHTFIINITGSIVMGLIAGYLAFKGEASQPWRLFLMTGILGGYTTFSAFSLDAALLYERGEIGLALFYVLGSVVLSIAGLFAARAGAPSGAATRLGFANRLSKPSVSSTDPALQTDLPTTESADSRRRRDRPRRKLRKPISWSTIVIAVLVAVSAALVYRRDGADGVLGNSQARSRAVRRHPAARAGRLPARRVHRGNPAA